MHSIQSARIHHKIKTMGGPKGRKMRFVKSVRLLVITIAMLMSFAVPRAAFSQVALGVSVNFAPPELPVYEQPICPGEGYIWTPGYWAWDDEDGDYYWVPGTWVLAPEPGFLWTPGYWGWGGTAFIFHEGYWGPRVGFYGGINYGYGYFGHGYEGGRWDGGRFYYNRAVNNVNVTVIHNVYETRVTNVNVTRVSYNGPNGGINERPRSDEEAAARQRHLPPVPAQHQHIQAARTNRELRASENRGKPPIAATQRPGTFTGGAVVPAKEGGRYNPPPNRGGGNENRATNNSGRPENNANRSPNTNRPENNGNRPNYVHPNDLPKANRPDRPPNAGNSKSDQKYQQQQDKMYQKQEQDRQKLQQKQDQEHQRVAQQKANPSRPPQVEQKQQQMEQRHQQQTQQMQQKHQQQQQKMEQRQQPRQQAPPHQNQQKPPNDKHP
jgi:WXXGXW repeat (2 copies)